jgi:hypothetical protein
MKLLLSALFFSISILVSAQNYQDSILLLNGISYKANVIDFKSGVLHFEIIDKKGKSKDFEITQSVIFSYHEKGTETILYKKGLGLMDDLEIHEVRRYAIGGYDARQTYNPRYAFWSTLVVTYGISLWDTYLSQKVIDSPGVTISDYNAGFFGKGPTMVPFVAPLLFTAAFGLPKMRVKSKHILHKNYHGDNMYYHGFNDYSRKKRLFGALKGSVLGLGLGLISYSVFRIN